MREICFMVLLSNWNKTQFDIELSIIVSIMFVIAKDFKCFAGWGIWNFVTDLFRCTRVQSCSHMSGDTKWCKKCKNDYFQMTPIAKNKTSQYSNVALTADTFVMIISKSHIQQVTSTKFRGPLTLSCIGAKFGDTLIYTLKTYAWHLQKLWIPACIVNLENAVQPINMSPRADQESVFRADLLWGVGTGFRGVETSKTLP